MAIVPRSPGRTLRFTNLQVGYLVDQCFAKVPGGTARYTRELGAALARTSGPQDSVVGWCSWVSDVSAGVIPGVGGPHRLAMPRPALARSWAKGAGPGPRNADVVHAPTIMAPPRRRRPLVVTIHDAVPWTHPETLTAHGVSWHKEMAVRAERADAIAVPTQAVADALLEHLKPKRVVVVGGAPAEGLLTEPADAAARRKALGLPADYALFVGTAEPRKGLDVALNAWLSAMPALPLAIVGPKGWGDLDLQAEVASRGMGSQILLLGQLGEQDLASVLHGSTVFVAPSLAEGFGLPLLEAMAAGVPAVLSADPAQVEVAGGAGVVVPIGDPDALGSAVSSLLSDSAALRRHAAAGLERAKAFSWDTSAAGLWSLYRELASK